MRALVDDVAARLTTALGGAWHGYKHSVPESPVYPYFWVYSNTGTADGDDFAESRAQRDVTVWVVCTAAGPTGVTDGGPQAAQQAAWGAEKAQAAIIGHRPALGVAAWKPVHLASQPPQRDDDLPERVVVYVVDQYGYTIQP